MIFRELFQSFLWDDRPVERTKYPSGTFKMFLWVRARDHYSCTWVWMRHIWEAIFPPILMVYSNTLCVCIDKSLANFETKILISLIFYISALFSVEFVHLLVFWNFSVEKKTSFTKIDTITCQMNFNAFSAPF